jgi:hypothetical protein
VILGTEQGIEGVTADLLVKTHADEVPIEPAASTESS